MNPGTYSTLLDQIVTDLGAHAITSQAVIVKGDEGDIANMIQVATAKILEKNRKSGISIIIWPEACTSAGKELQKTIDGATYTAIINWNFSITISEAFMENRDATTGTGIPARTMAEAVVAVLNRPRSVAYPVARYATGPNPMGFDVKPGGEIDFSRIGYSVDVTTVAWATAHLETAVDPGP